MAQNKIVKTDLVRTSLLTYINDDITELYAVVDTKAASDHTHGVGGTVAFSTGSEAERLLYAPLADMLWYQYPTKSFYFYDYSASTWYMDDATYLTNTGLNVLDTNGSDYLIIKPGSNLTSDRTLTITTGDADRTLILSDDVTVGDWFDQDVKTTVSPTFVGVTVGNTGLHILDIDESNYLAISAGSNLISNRQLTITTGDADRTLTISGDPTIADWFDQSVKTTSSPVFNAVTVGNTGLHILDTNASHDLIVKPGSDLTADRTLTITTGDAARTLTLSGDATAGDWFDQSVKTTASPTFNVLTLTTDLAITHGGTGSSSASTALVAFGLSATAAEINTACDGITATATEINKACDGITATAAEINTACDGITATAAEINNACDLSSNNFFGTGRKIVLYEDVAPTGWTIQNALDDKLLFITKGSAAAGQTGGGAHSAGSWTITGIAANNHALTVAQTPAHTHTTGARLGDYYGTNSTIQCGANPAGAYKTTTSSSIGSGNSHNHTATHTPGWRPAAYCCIVVAKN